MNDSQTKICLFGGTFDPIHLGHTFIAAQAVRELGIDKVIFLPCRKSPHKQDKQSAPDQHRLEMCVRATQALPWAEVHDHDLTAPSPSYSWRTAEFFRSKYPNARLYWLMGTDQWDSLERWNNAEYFTELVDIVVYSRNEPPKAHPLFSCTPLVSYQHSASATQIRNAQGSAYENAWVHADVLDYIKENQLYLK